MAHMTPESIDMPRNPKELAGIRAEEMPMDSFEHRESDARLLAELDYAASQLGFIGQNYFIEANRTLIIPKSWDRSEAVSYTDIFGVIFEAELTTYARVSIGRIVGNRAVRALCLAFDKALLLPYFDYTRDTDMVYVPVLAINSIEPVA
jgi:hypothetical protein